MNINDYPSYLCGKGLPNPAKKDFDKWIEEYTKTHPQSIAKEEITSVIEKYIKDYAAKDISITDIQKLIEKYFEEYAAKDVTAKDVSELIEKYIKEYAAKDLSKEQVVTLIKKYIKEYASKDLTKEQVVTLIEETLTKNSKNELTEEQVQQVVKLIEETSSKASQDGLTESQVEELIDKHLLDYNSTIYNYLNNYNTKIEQYLREYTSGGASAEDVKKLQEQLDKLQKQVVTNYQELSKGEQDTGKIWLDENTVYNRLVLPTTVSFNDKRWTYVHHIPDFENIQTIISIKGIITSYGKVQNAVHNVDIWRVTAEGNLEARSLFGETTVSAIYLEYTKKV